MARNISSDFPFESKYLDVLGSKMHYIEEYTDNSNPEQLTFLFLHGNPTSSYLWRNIVPYVEGHGKAVAPDLIGMGKSDKPDIDYTFLDHIKYLDEFIEQKKLKNIVLVIHDWGSALGFHYAIRNQHNIKGIAFMEAITKPMKWSNTNFVERILFKKFRDTQKGHKLIAEKNLFINFILFHLGIKRKLTPEEKRHYLAPYPTVQSRKPIKVWPQEIPFDGYPLENHAIISNYGKWLKTTNIPKLLLYASPGMIIKKKIVKRLKNKLKNLESVYLGRGKHYLQEDHPHEIGEAIIAWVKKDIKD